MPGKNSHFAPEYPRRLPIPGAPTPLGSEPRCTAHPPSQLESIRLHTPGGSCRTCCIKFGETSLPRRDIRCHRPSDSAAWSDPPSPEGNRCIHYGGTWLRPSGPSVSFCRPIPARRVPSEADGARPKDICHSANWDQPGRLPAE